MRHEPIKCPNCAVMFTGSRSITWLGGGQDHKPREHDLTVCLYCAQALEFYVKADKKLGLRKIDMATLDPQDRDRLGVARQIIMERRGWAE